MTRPDPYLWFAMRLGFPAFLTDGVAELLEGRALEAVPTGEASAIVEVLGHAQPLRAGVATVPPLVLAGLLDRTGIAGSWAEVMWTLALTAVMVVPAYMMVLGVVQVRLRAFVATRAGHVGRASGCPNCVESGAAPRRRAGVRHRARPALVVRLGSGGRHSAIGRPPHVSTVPAVSLRRIASTFRLMGPGQGRVAGVCVRGWVLQRRSSQRTVSRPARNSDPKIPKNTPAPITWISASG